MYQEKNEAYRGHTYAYHEHAEDRNLTKKRNRVPYGARDERKETADVGDVRYLASGVLYNHARRMVSTRAGPNRNAAAAAAAARHAAAATSGANAFF